MAWSYKDYTDNAATVAAQKKREEIEAGKPSDYAESEAVKAANAALQSHNANKPGEFTYADYVESDAVKNAYTALQQQLANKPGEYQSQWQQSLDDTMNKILNREKFTYDLNGDALYQQYKDQYTTQGNLAMMDTMGQAAALTGGYGNSYAQSVGQQAYQGYLQQLNDKVPELYQLALDQYNREGDELYNQYGLFADRENTDYGRYRDTVSDWNIERDYLTGRYDTESERDYGRYTDNRNFAYGQHRDTVADWQTDRDYLAGRYDTEYSKDYGQYRDTVSDWQTELNRADSNYYNERDFGYGQYSDDRNLSYTDYRNTVADEQWQKQFDEAKRQYDESLAASKSKSSGSGINDKSDSKSGNTAGVADNVASKASSFDDNSDLATYLDGLVANGQITEAQADALYAENADQNEKDGTLKSMVGSTSGWSVVDNGGLNWLWGVDNNAIVKAPNGKQYRLDNLVDYLVEEGMSKSDAKSAVKKLQKNLGV